MPILTLDQIRSESLIKKQNIAFLKTNLTKLNQCFGKIIDLWNYEGMPIASFNDTTINATGSILNNTSIGAFNFRQAATGSSLYIKDINVASSWIHPEMVSSDANGRFGHSIGQGTVHIWDRLWMNGGLTQTTPFPFDAPNITRYTDGNGLSLWYRMHTTSTVTTTGSITGSISYYNQDNQLKSTTFIFNSRNNINGINEVIPVPLAGDDYGIRKLASSIVTTTGNFNLSRYGFFIAKYYGSFKFNNITSFSNNNFSFLNGLGQVHNNACLTIGIQFPGFISEMSTTTSTMPNISGNLILIEA